MRIKYILVMSTGLLVGCAAVPVEPSRSGVSVDVGPTSYSVFAKEETAIAFLRGGRASKFSAQRAIERATGCPVKSETVQKNARFIVAQLACSQSTSIFLRARSPIRGRTARSGGGYDPAKITTNPTLEE